MNFLFCLLYFFIDFFFSFDFFWNLRQTLQISDLWFNVTEIFLLINLLFLSLQISLQKISSRFSFFFSPFLVLRKMVRILSLSLFLLVFNPFNWFFIRLLYHDFLITTPTIVIIKGLILFFSILILRSHFFYLFLEKYQTSDFFVFFGFLVFFLLIFVQVVDFFFLFLIFEIISILLFLLILHSRRIFVFFSEKKFSKYEFLLNLFFFKPNNTKLSILASIIYFLLNLFVSIFFLFGLSFLFFYFRTANFYLILFILMQQQQYTGFLFLIFFFFSFMFFYKFATVPFHWWISAVFESSSLLVLMFISIPMKIAFFYFFFRFFVFFFSFFFFFVQPLVNCFALFSLILGVFGLFFHQNLKKFWAYSTINHMGYFLLALNSFCFLGLRAFFIYLIFYLLINVFFFFFLQCLINEQLNQRIVFVNQLTLLVPQKNSWFVFFFSLMLFSLIGLPPFLGFWAKYLVICAILISFSFWWSFFLIFVILVTTIISAFCYLRLWQHLCLEQGLLKRKNSFFFFPIPVYNSLCLFVFFFLFIFFSLILLINNQLFYFVLDNFIFYSLLEHLDLLTLLDQNDAYQWQIFKYKIEILNMLVSFFKFCKIVLDLLDNLAWAYGLK